VNLKFGRGGVMPATLLPPAQRGAKPGRIQVPPAGTSRDSKPAEGGLRHSETGRKNRRP
jgi:DNA polymerase-4